MCPYKKKMNEIIIDADSSDSEMYTSTDTSTYDYDSDENDTSTQIYEEDSEFLESDKENNKYYIGLPGYIKSTCEMVLLSVITPKTFYKYKYDESLQYLKDYSILYVYNPKIHIMKLTMNLPHDTLSIVLKTYWLRIIQRTWKRVFRERCNIMRSRMSLDSMKYFEINGKYKDGNPKSLPSIHGMLYLLNVNRYKN
jgi:hypothetical protein